MIPAKTKITLGVIVALCAAISYFTSYATWYRDCLKVSKGMGYLFSFWPFVMAIVIWLGLRLNILPASLADEAWVIGSIIGSIVLVVATFKQLTSNCVPGYGYKKVPSATD